MPGWGSGNAKSGDLLDHIFFLCLHDLEGMCGGLHFWSH